MAETGPIPIRAGWTPVTDHPRGLTYARSPRLSARSRVVTTHTAAPSFSPLALPAVTVASGSSRERLNVHGSGISLVHPVGATGTRILTTMARELARRQGRLALETMCLGGGQGLAAAFERVP